MTDETDNWNLPFGHVHLATILHSTAMTRVATTGCLYEEAMNYAVETIRLASGRAAALLERRELSEGEIIAHRNAMDKTLATQKAGAIQAIGFDPTSDL